MLSLVTAVTASAGVLLLLATLILGTIDEARIVNRREVDWGALGRRWFSTVSARVGLIVSLVSTFAFVALNGKHLPAWFETTASIGLAAIIAVGLALPDRPNSRAQRVARLAVFGSWMCLCGAGAWLSGHAERLEWIAGILVTAWVGSFAYRGIQTRLGQGSRLRMGQHAR